MNKLTKLAHAVIPFVSKTLYPQYAAIWKADSKKLPKIFKLIGITLAEFVPFLIVTVKELNACPKGK